jgi:hypothetical protein
MDPERVDDRHREHAQGDRDLGRPDDREHGQRVAHEHHPARPDDDRRGVEVVADESEQRPRQREAEDRDVDLADERQADQSQRDRGDEHDARGQAVETVDEVDAIEHPDDPEDREPGGDQASRRIRSPPTGFDTTRSDPSPTASPARTSCARTASARRSG